MIPRYPTNRIHRMHCDCDNCSAIRSMSDNAGRRSTTRLRVRTAVIGLVGGALLVSAYAALAAEPTIIDLTIGARP